VASVPNKLQAFDLSLIDSLVVPASLHDIEGRFLHMNPAAERASGTSNADMLGRHFTAPLPPEEREKVTALFRRAVEHGEPTDFEVVFIDGGGHQRGARAQHLPLRSNDEIVGVLILAFEGGRPPFEPIGVDPQPRLTPRQREILDLIAAGASTSEIAKKLTLSTETVRNHVRNVLRELHVHSRLEAIAAARRIGLLAPPGLAAAQSRRAADTEVE
jgi:PAS domain S-box-containing protein